mgnify:CR=1 FL=1
MISLSTEAKEAIKIGVAIVIGYYVALRLDWSNPSWVATSIAFISASTTGQSLQKGALRLGGTLFAFVAGLFFLGLFPQDRWLFLLSFTPYLFFVAYMVQGRSGPYFWFVAGFVTMMIITAGPGSSAHSFEFAAYRALETAIGIGIWTAVSVFIWPRTSLDTLNKVSSDLLSTHGRLMRQYRDHVTEGASEEEEVEPMREDRDAARKLATQLEQTVQAAIAESHRVFEVRRLWTRFYRLSGTVVEILDRLVSGFSEMQKSNLRKTLLNEEALFDELEARLAEARRILGGEKPSRISQRISVGLDEERVARLDHFGKAALEVTLNELKRLDKLVTAILDCARDIEGYEPEGAMGGQKMKGSFGLPSIDPDRIRGAVMVTLSMWVGFFLWIYVDPPGHIAWYQFVPSLTLAFVQVPFLRLPLLKPFACAYTVGLGAYVFIMPQLSTFWQLAMLIFAFSFGAAYFLKGTAQLAVFLALFILLGIKNEQTYNFAAAANLFLFTMMALTLVVATSYVTRTPRPEKAFVSMVARFFRSCEFLLSRMGAEQLEARNFLERMRRAYHRQELGSLPGKLARWGKQIDPGKFTGVTPQRIDGIVASLQVLDFRLEDLIEARQAPHAEVFVRELTEDVRAWRMVIEENCRRWSECPETDSVDDLREKLKARLDNLNLRIEEVMNTADPEAVSTEERKNFYRLLGGFRGFSEAALVYSGAANEVDWERLREEKF